MNIAAKRVLVLIVGWAFVLLGFIGLFLPILQGVLFLVVGLVILSSEYVWAHRLLKRLGERFPVVARTADQAKERISRWLQRLSRPRNPD